MASFAYSWYGLLNKSLLLKFGMTFLHSSEISNGMPHIDGLSGLCLAASEIYSRHFKNSAFSKKHAVQMLTLIGHSGLPAIAANPNFNSSSSRGVSGPPLKVWLDLLQKQDKNPAAQAGTLLCFLVVTEIDPAQAEKGFTLDRADIVRKILSNAEQKHASIFGPIQDAIFKSGLFPSLKIQMAVWPGCFPGFHFTHRSP